jgi:RHS repeat-associated protein
VVEAMSVVYDGDGNRVAETAAGVTTKYLIDSLNPTGYSQVLDELVSGSVTKTYTYGRQLISENQLISGTWTPSFYGYDGHGNARFLANAAGTITDAYTFDAFGAPIASTGTTANSYLYSGERFDSSLSLYHLRDRYYNILTGRFETADPYEGDITDPSSLHKYVYAANNPVNSADPSGDLALEYTWLNTVKNRVYILAIHGAHHPFVYPIIGTLWCVHLQLTTYLPGVKGSDDVLWRIPFLPFLCSDTKGIPW